MFGLVDRVNYDIRIFYIIQKNVYTSHTIINNNTDNNSIYPATRIYFDGFQSYQINDFNQNGNIT
jgi:predicted house-cleaning NTP pyrophosphatase (Maf/HAM1 superfamily)